MSWMTHESRALGLLIPSQIGGFDSPAVTLALFALVMVLSFAFKRRGLDWMHPELRYISSHGEKKLIVRDAYKERWRQSRWAVIGWGLLAGVASPIIATAFISLPGLIGASQWVHVVVSMPVGLLGCWVLARWNRRSARPFFVEELAKRGIPLCRSCGYNLSHLTTTTCPECGRQFDPPAASID